MEIFIILSELRTSYLQYRICLSLRFGKLRDLRNLQKLLLSSLICRLRAVNEVVNFYSQNQFYHNSFLFTDQDKLLLALNLTYGFYDNKVLIFLVSKKKHMSSFFEISDFHSSCLKILFTYVVLPINESLGNRYCLGFRPYRDSHDIFYQLKSIFLTKTKSMLFFRTRFFSDLKINHWFRKNFPVDNFVKDFFILNSISDVSTLSSYNFYFIFVRFLLDGLV